jgi:hypothetical protein
MNRRPASTPPLSFLLAAVSTLLLMPIEGVRGAEATTTTPSGQLTLTDGQTTINFNLPGGFTEAEPSASNHRTIKGTDSVTQLTLLPPDQHTDASHVLGFIQNTGEMLKQAKGKDLVAAPTSEHVPGFALVMRYRVRQANDHIVDTTTRWRQVGPLVVQAVTDVNSDDAAAIKSANESVAGMLASAVVPGYQDPAVAAASGDANAQQAGLTQAPRQKFANDSIEFAIPNNFEQFGTSHGDATREYLSADHATSLALSVLPSGATIDSRFGPTQVLTAKRELAAGVNKPTTPPELIPNTTAGLVAIKWSFTRDGKPAQGFRLFRKVGPQVVRVEVTTTGDADAARQLGEQVLNNMTSLVPDQPVAASSTKTTTPPAHQLTGPAADRMNQRAQAALDQAKKLAADGKDDDAYAKYKLVVGEYSSSTAANEARDAIAKYEADPAFMEKHKKPAEAGPAEKAASLLAMGDNYFTLGNIDQAKAKYEQILKDYPDTPSAEKAKKRMAELYKPVQK